MKHCIQRYIFFISILFFTTCVLHVSAQTNVYAIDDGLYKYYIRCVKAVKKNIIFSMSDTLFEMSKKKKDVKAQCLAMNLKADYYYYNGDLKNLQIEKERIGDFARQTPFKQYVFAPWNRLISYYQTHFMLSRTLEEIKLYQKEALLLNNNYGIGASYRKMADTYVIMKNHTMAIKELEKAIDYFKVNSPNDLYDFYLDLAYVYLQKGDVKLAEHYFLEVLNIARDELVKGIVYCGLADIYISQSRMDEVEKYISLFTEWNKTYALSGNNYNVAMITFIKYYVYKKDFDKAVQYCQYLRE